MSSDFVTFLKTDEEFGGFSNMCGGYLMLINGDRVLTSEHLYQSLKFPDHPEIQKQILNQASPIVCKMIARKKEYQEFIRSDWNEVQLEVMEFCLKMKLIWNWVKFGNLLRATEGKTIYEISSKKDKYWGVIECNDGFIGENQMGKLLMNLRKELLGEDNAQLRVLSSPAHLSLRFLGEDIVQIDRRNHLCQSGTKTTDMVNQIRP